MTRSRLVVALICLGAVMIGLAALRTLSDPDYGEIPANSNVVVVGVSGLEWSDVSAEATPNLWKAADTGGSGVITTRAARSVTCPWDGWVTLGAGNRARYPAPVPEDELPPEGEFPGPGEGDTVPSGTSAPTDPQPAPIEGCLAQEGRPPTSGGTQIDPVITENDKLGFGAQPGALGVSVPCTTVVGSGPILAVQSTGADVRGATPAESAEGWQDIAGRCPLTLVQAPTITTASAAELTALDDAVGLIAEGVAASGGTLIIVGISQSTYETATLHPVIAVGAGLEQTVLTAPSTGRSPYLQLIDIAPTTLSILGQSVPVKMTGQVIVTEPRADSLAQTVESYREMGDAASAHLWISKKFFLVLSVLCLLGSVFAFLTVRVWPRLRTYGAVVGVVIGLLPAASFLANVIPWWLAGSPGIAVSGAIAAALAVLSAISLFGPWRGKVSGPPLAAAVLTTTVLGLDVLTGSHLQLNSPLGYDAIVAGRFTGFGNIAFAVFAAAALLVIAAAAALTDGSAKRVGLVVAVLGFATIALDGAPRVGADFGGVIALFPGLVLLGMIAAQIRISVYRLFLSMIGGGIVVGLIAFADYLRPASSRTHLGRFVGQILNGTALTIVQRKLSANLNLIRSSVLTLLVIGLVIVLLLLWFDRSGFARGFLQERAPYATAGLVGVAVMAVVGFAVNDSGIAVLAGAMMIAVPLVLAALARSGAQATSPQVERNSDHIPAEP